MISASDMVELLAAVLQVVGNSYALAALLAARDGLSGYGQVGQKKFNIVWPVRRSAEVDGDRDREKVGREDFGGIRLDGE